MYAVTVSITLHPGLQAKFLPFMLVNAAASREAEPGCRQFDVCTDPDAPDQVFLYETYDDRAAFDAHLKTAHFAEFNEQVADMVAQRELRCFADVVS